MEDNKNLIESFKGENKELSNQNEKKYLNDILTNKKIRRYIKNKLICIKQCFNNQILKNLDKDNFNKIINLLINYKIEDKENIEIFNDLQLSKSKDNDKISLFLILLCFIFCITIANKNTNDLSKNNLNILNPLLKYCKQKDIFSNLKLPIKKKLNIKKIKRKENNNNKFKIKIDNNKELSIDNSISLEERKNEESNKESKIIKIFLDSNENNENKDILKNSLNNNEKFSKTEYINELFPLKLPISNRENNKECNITINNKEDDSNFNLMEKIKNIQIKMKIKSKNNFKNKLLNELSIGNDIFKLNWTKFRGKKSKQENKEKEKEKEKEEGEDEDEEIDNKDYINLDEIDKKIKSENNIGKTIIKKKGTKIIIYDNFSEENKNDSGGGDYDNDFRENNLYCKIK